MALTVHDSLADMKGAREFLKKHIATMPDAHWDAKPLPHCNSVRLIFAHLLATDRAVLDMLEGRPFEMTRHIERHKEAGQEIAAKSPAEVIALYDRAGEAIADYVREKYGEATPDAPLMLWGSEGKIAIHLGHLSQETAYHTGQISLLHQATEPDWNYFRDVFGMG